MAYSAVISLQNTIHHFLHFSRISILCTSREILESAQTVATSLQQTLKRSDDGSGGSKRLLALDGRIREAVHNLEDILEFHESDQFSTSPSEIYSDDEYSSRVLFIDLAEKKEEINSLIKMVRMMEEEYVEELDEGSDDDEEDFVKSSSSSSSIGFSGVDSMVGLSDEYAKIKYDFRMRTRPDDGVVVPILGRAGSGRTLIARGVFDDLMQAVDEEPLLDCGAWVSVGQKYEFRKILMSILAQIDVEMCGSWELEGEKNINEYVRTSLQGRRCLIVLDDVWDRMVVDYTSRCFPEQDNGSILIFTTSVRALYQIPTRFMRHFMPASSEHLVWDILRTVLFGSNPCPPELEVPGKKIARRIEGRGLQVYKVILALWKAGKMPEYWNNVAADGKHPLFMVDDEIFEIGKIKEGMQQLYISEFDDYQRRFVAKFMDEMLNFSTEVEQMRLELFPKRFFPKMEISSYYGMAGIGKTTLVKKLFTDPSIFNDTDHRAWITLGPKYRSEEIMVDILAQMYPDMDKRNIIEDAGLVKTLCAKLSLKKCLIVLDDVWNQKPLHYLKKSFPVIKGKLLLTTRLVKVAKFGQCDKILQVRLLNREESWCLFCCKIFANGVCPPKLEKVGKKISENCEGLPLLIVTVADLLSKAEMTLEYWNEVAEKKNSLFMDAQNEISEILLPSYKSSPQHLKPLFLYMGIFPQSYEIHVSKLINLWDAEGFHEPNSCQNEGFVADCLSELADRSLVIACQMNSNFRDKSYRLHCAFWYLSTSEALKSMFYHALSSYRDYSIQDIKSHRRLCIRNSILLSISDVRSSIASTSSAHSLISNGPSHQYQVPICFDLRLLRVMDVLTIRLYEFPIDLVKLIHLRFLSLTYDGKLPAKISKLWNLQYLIVGRFLNIRSSEDSLYLPPEIWDMKELRHLQIMGGRLPNPSCGAVLPNLLTLLGVSAQSCTKRVLKGIPNLKKLGIQIELTPDSDDGSLFHCLNRIWRLRKLKSLKCVVVNPEFRSEAINMPAPCSIFAAGLKKLSLSGLGYPWEYMSIIGKLQNLEVLKVRCFAFRGPKWEITSYSEFMRLKFLSVEDSDMEHWGVAMYTLPNLKHLSFKHCYELRTLPNYLNFSIEKIEIIDCSPLVVTWAKQMKEFSAWRPIYSNLLEVRSSWDVDG